MFRIVHVLWTARVCVDVVSFHFYSYPIKSFCSISLLFSGYTISVKGRVFGEQWGGAAEILYQIGVQMKTIHIYVDPGGIRTYLYLLVNIDIM